MHGRHFTQEELYIAAMKSLMRYSCGGSPGEAKGHGRTAMEIEIPLTARDWLLNHILVADKAYAEESRKLTMSAGGLGGFFRPLIGG